MNPLSKKTFKILSYILEHPQFTMKKVSDQIDVSFGRVNKVINWLVERGMIVRNDTYVVEYPLRIISLISTFRVQTPAERLVAVSRDKLHSWLSERNIILSHSSALQRYSSYYDTDRIEVYDIDGSVLTELRTTPGGDTRLCIYEVDLPVDSKMIKGIKTTSKVRTIIDMFCTKRGYATRPLIKELWGIDYEY
jgi:DNA-binding Lrp family transcriptional regulator